MRSAAVPLAPVRSVPAGRRLPPSKSKVVMHSSGNDDMENYSPGRPFRPTVQCRVCVRVLKCRVPLR